jgi:hypothetical protein
MPNPANDIFRQAQQGSVAAVIQMLNEKLADTGVRTRAIFEDGALQLLCEAATPEQMEQPVLSRRVQQILEAIAPRNIRRVTIHSRIVCEQQLLWLDEIRRNPEKLLWSQEVVLKQPSFFKRLQDERRWQRAETLAGLPSQSPRQIQERRQFRRGGLLGAGALALALLAGWAAYTVLRPAAPTASNASTTAASTATGTSASKPASPPATAAPKVEDPFVEAVRLAEKASQQGSGEKSVAAWLAIASQWQQASDLMGQVATTDPRHNTAQGRIQVYRKNSEVALQAAEKARSAAQ